MSVAGIVIAQYGQVELTLRCLGTLRQFHPAIPIVIVDDGSPSSVDRRPLQLIADRHTTLLALPQRHGVTYAWNRGARWFQRNHAVQTLIFLNNDTITHGPWVEPLIEPLLESSALLSGAAWRAERRLPAIIHDLGRSHILAGWCLAIRTETFAILNEFDKRLRLYFSDTDLQCRLLLTSRDTTTPALALVSELPLEHTGHQSTSLLPDRRELWARDFDVFQRKWSRTDDRFPARDDSTHRLVMHLLQVCNVGNICGGTAACAWTTARALPNWQHTIWFLSPPTLLTRQEFAFAEAIHQSRITHAKLREIRPDLILWHNTSADRVPHGITIPSIQYQHSAGRRVPATQHVYCSRWLAQQCGDPGGRVLYQAVPLPARTSVARFSESCRIPLEPCTTDQVTAAQSNVILDPVSSQSEWTIGRICTPKPHKWGPHLIPFYQQLAKEVPEVRWEFVGCPPKMQGVLREACQQRANFHEAHWSARSHLWHWDALLYHQPDCSESFGRVCAEALRTGCIPLVDDQGGFREQIAPGTGYLCSSIEQFAAALLELRDLQQRQQMGRQAAQHGNQFFSLLRFQREFRQLATLTLELHHASKGK